MDFEYSIICASNKQATEIYKKVLDVVKRSGYITWADILAIVDGDLSPDDHTSRNIGWTKEGFKVRRTGTKLEFYKPDWSNNPEPKTECSTDKPIHIVIDTSKLEYFDETVECVLEHARKISDRTVSIKNVYFNDPVTVVIWEDGTKTIVRCGENEEYDPEKGLAMAISKKALGNKGKYYNQFKKWIPVEKGSCESCRHGYKHFIERPCFLCLCLGGNSCYEPINTKK